VILEGFTTGLSPSEQCIIMCSPTVPLHYSPSTLSEFRSRQDATAPCARPSPGSRRRRESITPRVELVVANSECARACFPSFYMQYMCHIPCINQ